MKENEKQSKSVSKAKDRVTSKSKPSTDKNKRNKRVDHRKMNEEYDKKENLLE